MTYRCLGAVLCTVLAAPAQSPPIYTDNLPGAPASISSVQWGDVDRDGVPDVVALADGDVLLSSAPATHAQSLKVTDEALQDLAVVRPANGGMAWAFATDGTGLFPLSFSGGTASRGAPLNGSWQMVVSLDAWSPPSGDDGYLALTDFYGSVFRFKVDTENGAIVESEQVAVGSSVAISFVALADVDGIGVPDVFKIRPGTIERFCSSGPQLNQTWGADGSIGEAFVGVHTMLRHEDPSLPNEELVVVSHTHSGPALRVYSGAQSVRHDVLVDQVVGLAATHYDSIGATSRQDVLITGADSTNFVSTRALVRRASPSQTGEILDPPSSIHFGIFATISAPVAADFDGDRDWDTWFARPDQGLAYVFTSGVQTGPIPVPELEQAYFDSSLLPRNGPSCDDSVWPGGDVWIELPATDIPEGGTVELRYWSLTSVPGEEPIAAADPDLSVSEVYEGGDDVMVIHFFASPAMAEDTSFYIEARIHPPETGTADDAVLPSKFYICGWTPAQQDDAEAYFIGAGLLDDDDALSFRGGGSTVVTGGGRSRGGRIRHN